LMTQPAGAHSSASPSTVRMVSPPTPVTSTPPASSSCCRRTT
jgi:hypothetical protein